MNQESVLELVKARGPLIPSQISKDLGTNILLASAILSEFASRNLVKVSNIKIGGSPLYYVAGQEEKLAEYMDKLQEKEKSACTMLKESKVLRDTALDPATRVALRQCRDFAKPLEVTINGQKELFWKWYMVDNQQAETSIKKFLSVETEQKTQETKKTELQKEIPIQKTAEIEQKEPPKEKNEIRTKKTQAFEEIIGSFFAGKKILVAEEQTVKKNAEMLYVIKIPTPLGTMTYLCCAKNKARCNEADISHAYVQGQIKKMPVIFLTNGTLTKKAEELLRSPEFSNLTHVKV